MKRFHAHVGSRHSALEQRPKVFKAVSMYTAIHVLSSMIYALVSVVGSQSFIRKQGVGIECRASSDVFAYFILQYSLATTRNHAGANLPATFQDSDDGSLVFAACSGDTPLTFADV